MTHAVARIVIIMKKIRLIFVSLFVLLLSSCSLLLNSPVKEYRSYTVTSYKFINKSDEFEQQDKMIDCYFKDDITYIPFYSYIKSLDGIYDNSKTSLENDNKVYTFNSEAGYAKFDTINNKIEIENTDSFSILKSTHTNYTRGAKIDSSELKAPSIHTINLNDYSYNIEDMDDDFLIPIFLFNVIFSANQYNVYFTGEGLYGFYPSISDSQTLTDLYYKSPYHKKYASSNTRYEFYNLLSLIMDHYYGLIDEKNIKEVNKLQYYKTDLLDVNTNINYNAFLTYLYTYLNDGHSYLLTPPLYKMNGSIDLTQYYSDSTLKRKDANKKLSQLRLKMLLYNNDYEELNDCYLRFSSDHKLAVIMFDSFETNNTAGTADTLRYFFNKIKEYDVEKVVFDISLNTGGNIIALASSLAFMTNEDITVAYGDTFDDSLYKSSYKIDVNLDDNYEDLDAFDYDYYILASNSSYSAANLMAGIAKDMSLATLIGEKTGGGACAVSYLVETDLSSFTVSSSFRLLSIDKNDNTKFYDDGVDVDYTLDYNSYYDIDKLYDFIYSL